MKVAMIGIRGVPAQYSGLETCAEEVGRRMVAEGHEVIVYCRRASYESHPDSYLGIRRITLPSLKTKYTDTFVHSLICMCHVLFQKPDVILAFNPAIASTCLIPKLFGYNIALNPNGFDWRRKKWGPVARAFIYSSAWLCAKIIDQMIIDAVSVKDYYNSVFTCRRPAIYIPNGGVLEFEPDYTEAEAQAVLDKYGLERNGYFLFLSRHEPENSCEIILEAFSGLDTEKKLFFGGGVTYKSPYAEGLRRFDDPRILFPGPVYDNLEVKVLHHRCYAVVHGNQPGGTSLGLLKAMGMGTCVLTVNTPDNAYAIKQAGLAYELNPEALRERMRHVLDHPERVAEFRKLAVERIREEYDWDVVAAKYTAALSEIAAK